MKFLALWAVRGEREAGLYQEAAKTRFFRRPQLPFSWATPSVVSRKFLKYQKLAGHDTSWKWYMFAMIDWRDIDTVLLDMDGTLLDLCFDNTLWGSLVPDRYCDAGASTRVAPDTGAPAESDTAATRGDGNAVRAKPRTREALFQHMLETRHTLNFYCLDYWADYTGLEIIALHHELTHLIQYRAGAKDFLDWLDRQNLQRILVTNAHPDSLSIKDAHSGLCATMHATVSAHELGHPKESAQFWRRLAERHSFDARRTLCIDDSQPVLDAAADFGIAHLLTIGQPDSQRPVRDGLAFPAFNDFADLIPDT